MEERRKSRVSMQVLKSQSMVRSTGDIGPNSISRLRLRKASFGFTGVPGIRPIERTSQVGMEFRRPPLLYLNTYQLDPRTKFENEIVEIETNKILDETFTDHKYNDQETPNLALRIAGEVMRKIKDLNFNRYRIITVVTIAQKRAQCFNNAITFLWDHERDSYVDLRREVNTAIIQVTTFGIYLD
ncbi:PREDICTED: tctex1 domain-containing protein 2-like [Papilio polytes]|uniref:tctex1 domain-containing protein 2-like n=1 Tax=Papilio polytes TaxID=76194 RepID=UPI000675D1EC|nr:PREDICTED: tctex1 domain-containing protein 2-like [Papilio polytes]